jgi:hypothetical protein
MKHKLQLQSDDPADEKYFALQKLRRNTKENKAEES